MHNNLSTILRRLIPNTPRLNRGLATRLHQRYAPPIVSSPADPFQLIGTVIDGKYRVDRLIGEGGFGVVYGGFHLLVAQPIAIKCMKPSSGVASQQQRATELFLREARVLFALTHPNIVRLYDVGAVCVPSTSSSSARTQTPYVALELISGISLDQEITNRQTQRGPHFTADEILTIFDQVLDAIAFAHHHGVTHRDIKPSNVMLVRASGRLIAKVVDFGIARVSTLVPDTSTGAAPFTPRYAAPEQWDPTLGVVGPASDIFALGLLLIETVTLSPALPGHSITELLNSVMNPQRRFSLRPHRPDLPADLENIINLATRTSPHERIRSAREMRDGILRSLQSPQQHPNQGVEATLTMASAYQPESVPPVQSALVSATTLPSGLSTTSQPSHSHTPLILGILGILAFIILGAIGLGGYFIYKTAHEIADTAKSIPSFPIGPQMGPATSSAPPTRVGPPPKGYVVVSAISGQDPFWTRAEIDAVVQAHLGELDLCFEQHLGKPRAGLEWDMVLVINPDGSVMMPNCDASGARPSAESQAAANCYCTKASAWRFPPAHGKLGYLNSGATVITLLSKASQR